MGETVDVLVVGKDFYRSLRLRGHETFLQAVITVAASAAGVFPH